MILKEKEPPNKNFDLKKKHHFSFPLHAYISIAHKSFETSVSSLPLTLLI